MNDFTQFAANMRLPDEMSKKEKEMKAEKILEDLELMKCLNTCK